MTSSDDTTIADQEPTANPATKACRDAESALGAVLSGDYTRDEFRLANRHLDACASCSATYATLGAFRKRLQASYGLERPRHAFSDRGRVWGSLAIAAALLVSVAAYQLAPSEQAMVAGPQPVLVTTVIADANSGATAPSLTGDANVGSTDGSVNEMDISVDEITDEELDEILIELGV